jgi:hypothetical protein
MADIDENAFDGGFTVGKGSVSMDADLVNDDVPFNLAFVESYYGDQSKIKSSPGSSLDMDEEQGDELIAAGLSNSVVANDRQ